MPRRQPAKEEKTPTQPYEDGGSSENGIDIQQVPVEIPETPEEPVEQSPEMAEAVGQLNAALVETAAKTIGRLAALVTKIPDMDFTDEEIDQLTVLWTPLMPEFSPLTAALLGTTVIFAGKVAIYMGKRKEVTGSASFSTQGQQTAGSREQRGALSEKTG